MEAVVTQLCLCVRARVAKVARGYAVGWSGGGRSGVGSGGILRGGVQRGRRTERVVWASPTSRQVESLFEEHSRGGGRGRVVRDDRWCGGAFPDAREAEIGAARGRRDKRAVGARAVRVRSAHGRICQRQRAVREGQFGIHDVFGCSEKSNSGLGLYTGWRLRRQINELIKMKEDWTRDQMRKIVPEL